MSSTFDSPRLPFRQWFPWLALFRAGGLAIGWPQLGISFTALVVFGIGTSLLSWAYPRETPNLFPARLTGFTYVCNWLDVDDNKLLPQAPRHLDDPNPLLTPWQAVAASVSSLVWSHDKLSETAETPPKSPLGLLANLAFAVTVWSLFGTAICRAVAVQIAKDRGESLPQAVRYAVGRWVSTVGAPSIPAGAILAVVIVLAIAAWLGRFPWIGGPTLALLSPVWFLAGLAIAFFALVIVCGWPLMIAAMGVEDCDGFGALSRTYSFLMGCRPQAAWNVLVSLVYGSALVALVGGVCSLALLAESKPIEANVGDAEKWSAVLQDSHFTAQLFLATFAVSLFWSLATVNYLLLRQAVDGKPFEDISPGVDDEIGRGLPVVGIPATDFRPAPQDGRPVMTDAESVAPAT